MPKLTDKQLVVLNAAAAHDGGRALPLPASLKLAKGPAGSLLAGLVKRGLLAACPATKDDEVWREDGDERLTLVISDSGLAALGITDDGPKTTSQGRRKSPVKADTKGSDAPAAAGPRPGSKLEAVVNLLRLPEGATVNDIMVATNWQAHSVRGAISGSVKRKLGLHVTSEVEDGRGRVYRIVAQASDAKS